MEYLIRDSKAEKLESLGLYRRAAARWAEVITLVDSDKEREHAVKRRSECIRKALRPKVKPENYVDIREAINRVHVDMGLRDTSKAIFRAYPKN